MNMDVYIYIFIPQEAKKKYDKETEKYCTVLEKHLSLSAKKKEAHLHEVCSAIHALLLEIYTVYYCLS